MYQYPTRPNELYHYGDLAHEEYPIMESIYIHHLNPITIDDILEERPCVFDLQNLVCVSFKTHNAIHYGSEIQLPKKNQ